MHLLDAAVLLTAVVSTAHALPTPAKGTFSVCTGSVCGAAAPNAAGPAKLTGLPPSRRAVASGNGDGSDEAAAEAARRRPQGSRTPTWLLTALPTPASAASVSYDFGYRLERSLDEDKRGPASDDFGGGAEALMNMCGPPTAEAAAEPAAAEITSAAEAASGAAALSTLKPAGTVGVAAAVAAAATPDPASSMEPLFAVCGDMIDGVLCHLPAVL